MKLVLNSLVAGDTFNIEGTVTVSEGLKNKIKENAVLFLFARSQEVQRGPPLAVQRITEIKFPYEFKIGP